MSHAGVIPPPEDRAQCKTCLDDGCIEVEDCTCGAGPVITMPCPDCQLGGGDD